MKYLSRRSLLLGSTLLLFSRSAWADSTKPQFEYIPSKLGIDYRSLAPSPLAEMLSQGEVEWMKNAVVDCNGSHSKNYHRKFA